MKVISKTSKNKKQDKVMGALEGIMKVCADTLSSMKVTQLLNESRLPFEQRIFQEDSDMRDYIKDLSC